jgi:hypothetical protein
MPQIKPNGAATPLSVASGFGELLRFYARAAGIL